MGSSSPKERQNDGYTGHLSIPESVSDKLYNSIVKIHVRENFGTGFFMKIEEENYLITCNHIVDNEIINSNETLEIIYGKKDETKKEIKLNSFRIIKTFGRNKDITLIEIKESDQIPEDKYLFPDLNYKDGYNVYNKEKIYIAGYPLDKRFKERQISSGEIINIINGYEFQHNADTGKGSSGSPICSFDSQHVIGIHKQYDIKEKINYGSFIGIILDDFEKNENLDGTIIGFKKPTVKKKFCNIDEYKKIYFNSHKLLLISYNKQNETNFYAALGSLKKFISENQNNNYQISEKFIKLMENFKNIDNNNTENILKTCLMDKGLIKNINKALRYEDKTLFENLYYFIAAFLKVLDNSKYGINKDIKLFRGDKMIYDDLIKFINNINNIIIYKGICSASKSRAVASVYTRAHGNIDLFSVIITIDYKFKKDCIPNCFDVTTFSKYEEQEKVIFSIYSCFKIIDVKIDENKQKAEIILESLGRKKSSENNMIKIDKDYSEFKIIENNNILEIS